MSALEKRLEKFNRVPVPNDITFDEVEAIARYYNCVVLNGGKHGFKIAYKPFGVIIPIPRHSNTVEEAYIRELKKLFLRIQEEV